MDEGEHLSKLREGVDAWNAWRVQNPDKVPFLKGADLQHADLREANLKGADLEGADLSGANL